MQTLALQTNANKRNGRRRRRRNRRGKKKENRTIAELNNLPQEIVLDILSRLPLKSVVRSMCVSKKWRSLIEVYAQSARRQKILAQTCLISGSVSLQSIDQQGSVESVRRPLEKSLSCRYLGIFGSCNGLLLLLIDDDLFLWNPLTRYSKKVLAYYRFDEDGYRIVSGLCFDSSSNEYKAVMALAHITPDYGGEFVVVGSFRSKSWTAVSFPFCISNVHSGPVLNENLHWFASEESSCRFLSPHQIVAFDPRMDKFMEVPMPLPKQEDGDIILGLGALDGCLCMARFDHTNNSEGNEGNVEVLAMKEYGMESSWTVMFVVSNLTRLFSPYDQLVPLCCTNNDEVIIKISLGYANHIWVYNSNDNSHRNILFPANHHYLINAVMYEESLVTPPAYDWEEDELRGEATSVEKSLLGFTRKLKRVKGGCWKYLSYPSLPAKEYEDSGSGKFELEPEE